MTIRSGDACQSRPLLVGSQLLILRPLQQLGDVGRDPPRSSLQGKFVASTGRGHVFESVTIK
jgi:hypothetical protein